METYFLSRRANGARHTTGPSQTLRKTKPFMIIDFTIVHCKLTLFTDLTTAELTVM